MKIKDIFNKSLDRPINPAVVVSNKDAETVSAEIKEYIFTDELIEKLYILLNTILNKRTGKTGIWINGYYGSGKSHFIKYAHYCFHPATSEEAFEYWIEAVKNYDNNKAGRVDEITVSNVVLLKKRLQATLCDDILFNVEDETDDAGGERLTRIFLNMFNRYRGYNASDIPLALLFEKYLDNKGKFAEFKEIIAEELGYDWDKDAAQAAGFELESILFIGKRLIPEMDTVSLHHKLTHPDSYKVGIASTLIPELKEYIAGKGKDYRLVFLVDEVSQYIGKNPEILLNFQNIIERVSQDCQNQVWIACTAQQTLEEVAMNADTSGNVKDEFGKILGRFDTRISLQSNDASYITQKRVLDKSSDGIRILSKLFRDKKDYIQNQFKLRTDLYKGYETEDDFILAYPFVPFQFKLISQVFEAFQNLGFVIKEVKDNERSVLGITHFTTKEETDKGLEVGAFLPFDAFFNKQFRSNLTHRGQRASQAALDFTAQDVFAQRVVKNLFMISNLSQTIQLRFASTVDNLTVLMMNELDQNRLQLQNRIKDVLGKLIENSLVREENGSYFFFNEDEMDVQSIIKNLSLNYEERLTEFDDIFRKMVKITGKHTFGQNDFRVGYAVEDKEFLRNGDFKVTVLLSDAKPLDQKALANDTVTLSVALNEWYLKDSGLNSDFIRYCQTLKFFRNNAEAATGERTNTIQKFKERNTALLYKINQRIEAQFAATRFISGNQILEANEIAGTKPEDRLKNAIEKHLDRLYKFHKLSSDYARTQQELKERIPRGLQTNTTGLTPAEERVEEVITKFGGVMNIEDLVREFSKPPFGWRSEALLDVIVQLVKKKRRELVYRNEPRYGITEFINKALVTSERSVCVVKAGEEIDQATLDATMRAYADVFNETMSPSTDGNELFDKLKAAFKKRHEEYAGSEKEFYGHYPFGVVFRDFREKLAELMAARDPKILFSKLCDQQTDLKKQFDQTKGIADFIFRAKNDYDAIRKFYDTHRDNIEALGPDLQEKADRIEQFLKNDDPRFDFRHIKPAYEEIRKALKEFTETLRAEVVTMYAEIFAELTEEAKKQGVTESGVYADEARTLDTIRKTEAITQLQLRRSEASKFKTDQVTKIVNEANRKSRLANPGGVVRETQEYYLSGKVTTISTEAELEAYLLTTKTELLRLLQQNKVIILK